MTPEPVIIITDTRERHPYTFAGYPVEVCRAALRTGDYSIPAGEGLVTVERKELGDLMNCLGHERARFVRELERMAAFTFAAVIVEAEQADITEGRYRAKIPPHVAMASIAALWGRFKIPFAFAGSRAEAERLTYELMRRFTLDARKAEKPEAEAWPEPYAAMVRGIAGKWNAAPEGRGTLAHLNDRGFVGCGIPRAMAGPDESGGHTLDHPPG